MQQVSVTMIAQRCRACGARFAVCSACFRGQVYCGAVCRQQSRKASLRRADMRWRGSEQGKVRRRTQARRRYKRRQKVAALAESLGDQPSGSSDGREDGGVSCADVPVATLSLCPESPHASAIEPARFAFYCRLCRFGSHSEVRLDDHLATRDRLRAQWLEERPPRGSPHRPRRPP